MIHDQHEHPVAERAALWCSQLPDASLTLRREFVRWLKQSPLHVREMLLANALDMELGRYDPERKIDLDAFFTRAANNVTPLAADKREAISGPMVEADHAPGAVTHSDENAAATEPAAEAKPRSWKSSSWLIGIAAAASILAVVLSWPGIIKGGGVVQRYQTQTGVQRTIPLADGSVMHLNTQSNVRVEFSEETRDIYLEEGQAMFDVAHNAARPFRVHVKHAVVQAIGTQFDVNRQTDHTDVAVIEGRVKVTAEKTANTATDVSAGEAIRIAADGSVSSPVDIKVAETVAWRSRRLVFRNNTLEQIAAEFNRYNRTPKIRVEGAILQAQRYSGMFDANDPESFLQYLAADRRLAFDRSTELVVVRLRSSYASATSEELVRKSAANKSYPPRAITTSP